MEIPYFSLKDENGKTITREDLKGKPSVLIFWGLNCGSCKKELPIFNKFYEKYKDKINFYAIVIDTNDVKEVEERKYLWGFDIPVLLNGRNIMYKYRIFGVPITYLVDKNLKKKKILIGRVSEEKIKKEINNLLQD
jgi:thiol-disulfide isomerase/thioredoxin